MSDTPEHRKTRSPSEESNGSSSSNSEAGGRSRVIRTFSKNKNNNNNNNNNGRRLRSPRRSQRNSQSKTQGALESVQRRKSITKKKSNYVYKPKRNIQKCSFNHCTFPNAPIVKCIKCRRAFHTDCIGKHGLTTEEVIELRKVFVCNGPRCRLSGINEELLDEDTKEEEWEQDDDLITPNGKNGNGMVNGNQNGNSINNQTGLNIANGSQNGNNNQAGLNISNYINQTGLNITNDSQNGDNNGNEDIEEMTRKDVTALLNSMNQQSQLENQRSIIGNFDQFRNNIINGNGNENNQNGNGNNNLSQDSNISRPRSPSPVVINNQRVELPNGLQSINQQPPPPTDLRNLPPNELQSVISGAMGNIANKNGNNDSMSMSEFDGFDEYLEIKTIYKCDICQTEVKMDMAPWKYQAFRQFVRQFVCHDCQEKRKIKNLFKCFEHCNHKGWNGNQAFTYWMEHVKIKHNTKLIRNILELHLCSADGCNIPIPQKIKHCTRHTQDDITNNIVRSRFNENDKIGEITVISGNNHNGNKSNKRRKDNNNIGIRKARLILNVEQEEDDEYNYKQSNGRNFNLKWLFSFVSVNRNLKGDKIKDRIANAIKSALKDLTDSNRDLEKRINKHKRGIIKLKLIAGTYIYRPFREGKAYNADEMEKRHKLYISGDYDILYKRIMEEQNKIDMKTQRKMKREINGIEKRNINDINQDDIKMEQKNNNNNDDDGKEEKKKEEKNQEKIKNRTKKVLNRYIDYADLVKGQSNLLYGENDNIFKIAKRMNKCIYHAQRGEWKKADSALDPGSLVNMYKKKNEINARKKFPKEKKNDYKFCYDVDKMNFDEYGDKLFIIKGIMLRINRDAAPGLDGIDNKQILWMIDRDDIYEFVQDFIKFMEFALYQGYSKVIRRLLMHSKGNMAGKEKYGIPDYDVRPIVVVSAFIRMMDKIIMELHRKERKELIGPYQLIGQKQALEKGSVITEHGQRLQEKDENLVVFNGDAANAYNSISRNAVHGIVLEKSKRLANWFSFLYSDDNHVTVDHIIDIQMETGVIQGLASSEMYYSSGKWKVLQNAIKKTKQETGNGFKVYMEEDYVDDGNTMMDYRYLNGFMRNLGIEYKEIGIDLNLEKSLVALKTHNKDIQEKILEIVKTYKIKYTFKNEYKFLGRPYGTKDFINEFMDGRMKTLWIKLQHILLIGNSFIRHNLLKKMYGFNKVIYYLKVVPKFKEWMETLGKIHNVVSDKVLVGIQITELLKNQMPMAQRNGGFALRNPSQYQFAAEITTLRDKVDHIIQYFPFSYNSFNYQKLENIKDKINRLIAKLQYSNIMENYMVISSRIVEEFRRNRSIVSNGNHMYIKDLQQLTDETNNLTFLAREFSDENWFIASDVAVDNWNEKLEEAKMEHGQKLDDKINKFNELIGPNYEFKPSIHKTNGSLLALMDRKLLENYKRIADLYDMARIKCIQNNGALSWSNVPYNMKWSRQLSNQQMYIALSLVTGNRIFYEENPVCKRCNKVMDHFGYHALSCPSGGMLFDRHDAICDILYKELRRAGYTVLKEQRYENIDGKKKRITGRPGDLLIKNWKFDEKNIGSLYIDVTIGNIFTETAVKGCSLKRLDLAEKLSIKKDKKYQNRDDIRGLGMECLGGMAKEFKALLQRIAADMENRTGIDKSIWMNRLRSRIMIELMLQNAKMIRKSSNLIPDDLSS